MTATDSNEKKLMTLAIPRKLLARLDAYRAARGDISRSACVRQAVEFFLRKNVRKM